MQAPDLKAMGDRVMPQAEAFQLTALHNPMLDTRQSGDRKVTRLTERRRIRPIPTSLL